MHYNNNTTFGFVYFLPQEIREYLYSEPVMENDDSTETEIPPKKQHSFSGMGGGESSGKYDGFGNTPIQRGIHLNPSRP